MNSKIIFFLFFTLMFKTELYSQTNWFWQNPLPQGNNLNAVKFIDNNTGWTVGEKGTILKTINGGLNWSHQNSGVLEEINDVYILSHNVVLAIGNYGVALYSSDGGNNWSYELVPNNPVLKKFYFTNDSTGFICGYRFDYRKGYIFKTTNGGVNWFLNFVSPDNEYFDKLFFWDEDSGLTGGDWFTYKTSNSGNNWNQIYTGMYGKDLIFKNLSTGIIVGGGTVGTTDYGYIRKTTNGGLNYYHSLSNTDTIFNSITNKNSDTLYASGNLGRIIKSTNYGDTWNFLNSFVNENLNSIYSSDHNIISAVGNSGVILNSTNEGINWSNNRKGLTKAMNSIQFFDENTGWINGNFGAIKTTNGGTDWTTKWDSACVGNLINLIHFTNSENGWLLYNPSGAQTLIYKTTNSGEQWTYVNSITGYYYRPWSMYFIDNLTGFITGQKETFIGPGFYDNGYVMKTTNGGLNWDTQYFNNKNMYEIKFVNNSTGYLVGDDVNILKTTNAGDNWSNIAPEFNYNHYFYQIRFINSEEGWILGKKSYSVINKILKTTNGGLNWEDQTPLENITGLYSLQFKDSNIGWACGSKGLLYATTNGGQNWIKQDVPTNQDLYSVYFHDYNTGWISGTNGSILKTTSGLVPVGIQQNSYLNNLEFKLSQNYQTHSTHPPIWNLQFRNWDWFL